MPKVAELGSGRTGARRRASWMPGRMLFGRTRSRPDQGDEPTCHDYRCVAGLAKGQVRGGDQTRCRITWPW